MNEYTRNCKRTVEILKQRPWLFRKNAPAFTLADYLKYFEHLSKAEFFVYSTMMPYKVGILDKYKSKVFNTFYVNIGNSTLSMNTLLQLSASCHILLNWGYSEDNNDTLFFGTMYTDNPTDYPEFIINNEEFIYEEVKPNGFSITAK
jgi:hypothetical protein